MKWALHKICTFQNAKQLIITHIFLKHYINVYKQEKNPCKMKEIQIKKDMKKGPIHREYYTVIRICVCLFRPLHPLADIC